MRKLVIGCRELSRRYTIVGTVGLRLKKRAQGLRNEGQTDELRDSMRRHDRSRRGEKAQKIAIRRGNEVDSVLDVGCR